MLSTEKMSPKTIPPIMADFAFKLPRILDLSPTITLPSVSRFPSISPSTLTKPFIFMSPVIFEPFPIMVFIV